MGRRNREIILDFTSLLDIIMLVLFFFVMFSSFEIEKKAMAKAEAELSDQFAEAERLAEENEALKNQLDHQISEMENAHKRDAENADALSKLETGEYFTLDLAPDDSRHWNISVKYNEEEKGFIENVRDGKTTDETAEELKRIIAECGFTSRDTLVITVRYKSYLGGSYDAFRNTGEAVEKARQTYTHIFRMTLPESRLE